MPMGVYSSCQNALLAASDREIGCRYRYQAHTKPIPTKHPPSLIGGSVRSTMLFDPSPVPIFMLGRAELDPTVTQARAPHLY